MMLTMKLWCSLWLLDLVHAAKVKPSVNVAVAAPLDLVVQEPGFGSSNHTQLFKKLGDEPALALMNVTTNHSLFVKGDEAVHDLGNASEMYMEEGMEHDIVDGLESEGEHDDAYGHDEEHYHDEEHDHFLEYDENHVSEFEKMDQDDSLALASEMASEKGLSVSNSSMNLSEAMTGEMEASHPWRLRLPRGCWRGRRWGHRVICTHCHSGWRRYGHYCHERKCGHPCKSCPGFWHRQQNNHCNSCHGGWALVGRTCKTEHVVHSGWSRRGDDKVTWVKDCWSNGGTEWSWP